MKCKYCGEDVGEFYSDLETHLWEKHREKIRQWLEKQTVRETKKRTKPLREA